MATISATKSSVSSTLTGTTADIIDFTNMGVGAITVFNHDPANIIWVTTGGAAQLAVVAAAPGAIPVFPRSSVPIANTGGQNAYVSVIGSGGMYTLVVGRILYK